MIGMWPCVTSKMGQFGAAIAMWMLAANSTPLPQACGASRTACALVSAAMRLISVMPPARATSGCAMSSARRSSKSTKSNHVNSRSPEAMGIIARRTSACPA
jgi:hypothetical protein